MTINELLEQGIGIQGPVRVIGIRDSCDYLHAEVLANWLIVVDEPWADLDIDYIYPKDGELVIELKEES